MAKRQWVLFPKEILRILQGLKSKVRARDERRAQVPASPKPANLPAEGLKNVTITPEKVEREEGDE